MTQDELELLAMKAGLRQARVMPRSKRSGIVCHVLLFTCSKGRQELELPLTATAEDARAAIDAALVG
jgi:hypothetical protein